MQEDQGSGQPFITMGSIISLSHFEDNNSFIFIDGHIKQKVMVRNFSFLSGKLNDNDYGTILMNNNDESVITKNLKFSGCLFQILPKLSDKQKEEIQMKTKTVQHEEQQPTEEEESLHYQSRATSQMQSKFEFNLASNVGSQQLDTIKEINFHGHLNQQEEVSTIRRIHKKANDLDKDKVLQLQGKLMNEFKVNYEAFEKYKNNRITYNQTIQLMHVNSSKFLACYPIEAAFEKGNYRVTLDDYTSENTLFRIVPAFKYQKDGDLTIYANEIIAIERVNQFHNKKTTLHSSDEIIKQKPINITQLTTRINTSENNYKKADTIQVKLPLRMETNFSSQRVFKREVNISTENETDPTKWKNHQKFLRCGDVIWLHHSEANASLGALRIRELKDLSQNDWHHMDSKDNLEVSIVPSDISNNLQEYSGNTCGMWIIERKNFKVGGKIKFDNYYRLRHLSSGLYLSAEAPVNESSQSHLVNQEDHVQMKLVNIPTEGSLFQFISLENSQSNQQDKYIKSDSFVQLRHVLTKSWVDLSQTQETKQQQQQSQKKPRTTTNLLSQTDLNKTQTMIDKNQIMGSQATNIKPFLSQTRSENQVFKLFQANESDVWEINYVNSASKELTKILKIINKYQIQKYIIDKENPLISIHLSQNDFTRVKFMKKKLGNLILTIKHLNEFCNNHMHNSSFDQKYGSINHYRQKLLREQYFIDILTQLLKSIFQRSELEHLKNLDDNLSEVLERKAQLVYKMQKQKRVSRTSNATFTNIIRPQDEARVKFNTIDYMKYIKQKRSLCISIYKLLTSICKLNPENEFYTYSHIPLFQTHCKYVPQAIDCLISIISQNEGLLLRLSENLIIKNKLGSINTLIFDRPGYDEIDVTHKERGKERKKTQLQQMSSIHHETEQNLLNYFMDLVYDQDAPLKADYYRFLSSICRLKNDGISLNQENIYKLFKSISTVNPHASHFIDKFKNGIEFPETQKDVIKYIQLSKYKLYHQLTFLSDLSFGRNFQWLRELVKYFKFDYLLQNIWKNIRTNSTLSLSSCFSKLAMALYIDHYPLYRVIRPNFCRVFHDTRKEKQILEFKPDQQNLYQGLLDNLISYLKDLSNKVDSEFNNHELSVKKLKEAEKAPIVRQDTETRDQNNKEVGIQILNEDLLYQSVNMLNLLIDLDAFNIMNRQKDYEFIVQYLLKIFIYDRMNILFSSTAYCNAKRVAEVKQEDKKNALLKKFVKIDVKIDDFNFFSDDAPKENEEEDDENIDGIAKATSKIDENQLYHNPLMRGYLKMNCLLEKQIQSDEEGSHLEINIKLEICDLFDKLLDLRQDFLIENTIHWFYKNINNIVEQTESDKVDEIMLEGISKILPNIPKTGIKEVDEEYNKPKEENTFLKVLSNENKRFYKFENFSQYLFHDLDSWLSISYIKNDDEAQNPSHSILPYLLQNFILIHHPELEKKCLSLLMRVFNQRTELLTNLNKLEIIFDKKKAILYKVMTDNVHEITKLIEQTEDWFEEFIKDDKTYDKCEQIKTVSKIIKNLKNSFYYDCKLDEENKTIFQSSSTQVDINKQKIFYYLKAHEPLIEFIKDGMHHFNAIMSDQSQPNKKKQMVYELFQDTFELLINFCQNNKDNQMILHEQINGLLQYLHFDVGQLKLLCEIFRDNMLLLKDKSNRMIIQTLIELILDFGRQHRILDFFIVFQKCQNTYIFDNQLLILNTFLPINDFGEDELKLLYSIKNQKNDRTINLDFKNDDMMDIDIPFIDYFLLKKTAKRDDTFLYHAKLLQLLLSTTYIQVLDDKINTKQNFNISIAKLKTLDSTFLKDQLIEVDNFKTKTLQTEEGIIKSAFSSPKKADNIFMLMNNKKFNSPQSSTNIQKEKVRIESEFQQKGLTYLKPYIVDFLKNVYILGESSTVYQGDGSLSKQFLDRILSSEILRMKEISQPQDINDEYVAYLFNHIVPFLQAYLDKYLQNSQPQERKDYHELKNFANEFMKIRAVFDGRVQTDQNHLMVQFLRIVLPFEDISSDLIKIKEFLIADISFENQEKLDSSMGVNKNINIDKPMSLQSEGKDSNHNLNSNSPNAQASIKQPKTKSMFSNLTNKLKSINIIKQLSNRTPQHQIEIDNKISDIQLKKNWNTFLKCLNQTDEVQEEINKEKIALTDAFLEVKKLIPDEVYQDIEPKPDKYSLIKKCIVFLQYAVEDPSNKKTIQVLLSVLRNVVDKCDELEDQQEEEKQKMQNTLDQLGATRMALYVISESHKGLDSELLSNFLKFLNTLLDGGNNKVQRTLYEYYISHQKSEMIFKKFDQIIRKQIQTTEEAQIIIKGQYNVFTSSVNIIQNFYIFSLNHKVQKWEEAKIFKNRILNNQIQFSDHLIKLQYKSQRIPESEFFDDDVVGMENDIEVDLLDNVLTFLQLSAEGHYLNLQNYLRQQTNSRNSFDMINAVAELLKAYYFNARTQKMYENMIQCLDTLNELVQGPCLENQIAVSESKFFEIVNDLFTHKKQKQELLQQMAFQSKMSSRSSIRFNKYNSQGDDLVNWQIARMQNKCLILILSLLEMRVIDDTNIIIKKIMRNISLQQLEYQLVDVYKLYEEIYKDEYTMECLDYLNQDPKDVPSNKQQNLECVVQNGFYIIFLVQYYMLFDEKQENIFTSLYKQHKAKKLKTNQNALEGLLYGDHLFGQVASFVMNIIREGMKTANQMKAYAMIQLKGEEDEQKRKKQEEDMHRILLKKAYFFFSDNIGHIDIVRNNQIEIVFFFIMPYMNSLPKEKKTDFHDNVDRQSVKSKVEYLVVQSETLIEICKHEFKLSILFSHNKFIALFANYVNLWKQMTFTMTLILNVFNMISFDSQFGDRMNNYQLYDISEGRRFDQQETKRIYLVLGMIMTVCSAFVVLFFLFKNVPLIIKKNWIVKYENKKPGIIKRFTVFIKLFLKVLFIFLQEIEVMYYIAYGSLAVLGTFYHPLFFTFHLTEILIRYPTLKNVIKSVYIPRKSFYLTFILFLILVYSFTVLSFNFFHKDYLNKCDRMLVCFLINFDQTFKSNGAVGGWLTSQEEDGGQDHQTYTVGRLFFDNLYNYILVIILVEIVAGLIVEAFEDLREKEQSKNRDISDKCFVCDNQKTEFNRKQDNNGGFLEHIKINHYMWNYVNFIAYLRSKESTEYTGIESFIYEKLESNDVTWQLKPIIKIKTFLKKQYQIQKRFPINKARELNLSNEEDEEKEFDYIKKMNMNILNTIENLKEINKSFSKSSKKKQSG